jgi:acidic leucine-rich nuclear phosphoprotein 32 family protein A/C/D
MDLESAIAQQVGDRDAEEIRELVLDACKATKVSGLEKFVNLETLTLNGCGLTSLDGFPTAASTRSRTPGCPS